MVPLPDTDSPLRASHLGPAGSLQQEDGSRLQVPDEAAGAEPAARSLCRTVRLTPVLMVLLRRVQSQRISCELKQNLFTHDNRTRHASCPPQR